MSLRYFPKKFSFLVPKIVLKNYQKQVLELEQIERLYELQQEGLINIHTGDMTEEEYEKYNKRLLNKLSVLHLTS